MNVMLENVINFCSSDLSPKKPHMYDLIFTLFLNEKEIDCDIESVIRLLLSRVMVGS